MSDQHRLTVKLPSGAEFTAEGSEQTVRELFSQFLAASSQQSAQGAVPLLAKQEVTAPAASVATNGRGAGHAPSTVATSVMERVFSEERGALSLRVLPATENAQADALLLIIYGYHSLKKQPEVTTTMLMKGARLSGIQSDRADRLLAPNEALITKSGFKKGRRYGINNPGIKHAEELLSRILN